MIQFQSLHRSRLLLFDIRLARPGIAPLWATGIVLHDVDHNHRRQFVGHFNPWCLVPHDVDSLPVGGLFDKIGELKDKFDTIKKWFPLLQHLGKAKDFFSLVKSGEFSKAVDIVETILRDLNLPDVASQIDELQAAFASGKLESIIDELGDGLKLIARVMRGERSDPIRIPAFAGRGDDDGAELKTAAESLEGIFFAVKAGPNGVEETKGVMELIALGSLLVQVIRFVMDRRDKKKA